MTAGVNSKKSDYPDWLIFCGAKVAVLISAMSINSLVLIFWMLWSCSSSALVAIVLVSDYCIFLIEIIIRKDLTKHFCIEPGQQNYM